jgi:hypothetical protein
MHRGVNEESEQMLMLLQELAALEKSEVESSVAMKRREEITREIKEVAAQKKQHSATETLEK